MTKAVDPAPGYGSRALIAVGGMLAGGAVLTGLGVPDIGWTIYSIGYIGALAGLAALAARARHAVGRFGRIATATASAGMAMGLPELLMVWGLYTGTAPVHDLFMPLAAWPLVALGGLIAWTGVLLFGMAMMMEGRVPKATSFLLIVAALLSLPFELRMAPQILWVASLGIVFGALATVGPASRGSRARGRGLERGTLGSFSA